MSIYYRKINNNEFPYVVDISDMMLHNEIHAWAIETFGRPNTDDSKWVVQWNGFRFKEEAYVTWLIMRFFGQSG